MIVFVIQRVLAHYRQPIFTALSNDPIHHYHFITGQPQPHDPPLMKDPPRTQHVRNIYFSIPFSQVFFYWQTGLISILQRQEFDLCICGFEPYNLSGWIATIVCKLKNRPIILWTNLNKHEKGLKKWINILRLSFFDAFFLYGNFGNNLIKNYSIGTKPTYVLNNSLDYENQQKIAETISLNKCNDMRAALKISTDARIIIHIGRLLKTKRLEQLIEATGILLRDKDTHTIIIGDGPERSHIQKYIHSGGLNEQVHLIGDIYDEVQLAHYISMADIAVFPGNGGLAIIHCLTYGTPVVVHDNNLGSQTPEAEAIVEGQTGAIYQENNIPQMVQAIQRIFNSTHDTKQLSERCRLKVLGNYTAQSQKAIITNAIEFTIKVKK
jgi:glycosyltransferase involved in cell wall biosynthesis